MPWLTQSDEPGHCCWLRQHTKAGVGVGGAPAVWILQRMSDGVRKKKRPVQSGVTEGFDKPVGCLCKEIEENKRMGKTRDLFKKIRDTRDYFMQRWA